MCPKQMAEWLTVQTMIRLVQEIRLIWVSTVPIVSPNLQSFHHISAFKLSTVHLSIILLYVEVFYVLPVSYKGITTYMQNKQLCNEILSN